MKKRKGIFPKSFRVSETTEGEESEETFALAYVKTDALEKVKHFTVDLHVHGKLRDIWKDTVLPKVKTTKVNLRCIHLGKVYGD